MLFRLLYRMIGSETTVRAAAAALALAARALGDDFPRRVLDTTVNRLGWSGWPAHTRGWVNLDVSRFVWRVRDRLARLPEPPPQRPVRVGAKPLRVGLVGELSGLLPTPPKLLAERPDDLELHVIDVEFAGRRAAWAEPLADSYVSTPATGAGVAAAVNAAAVDVLVVFLRGTLAHATLARVDAPVIVDACTGPDLLHHPHVSFSIYAQPEADYLVHGDRLFCGTSRAFFGDETVYDGFLYFDDRGLAGEAWPAWREREPLIVYHGSLYKATTPTYLEVLLGLLREDDELRLALIGRDDGVSLAAIRAAAVGAGAADRVTYEGGFEVLRDGAGVVNDDAWSRARSLLAQARLAPDPWPISGSSARVEAYAARVPTPHLGLRLDPAGWGRPQPCVTEHPSLSTASGTATTVDEYRELCRRGLYDEAFAERVVAEQLEVLRRVTSPERWWQQLVALYHRYCEGLPVASGATAAAHSPGAARRS